MIIRDKEKIFKREKNFLKEARGNKVVCYKRLELDKDYYFFISSILRL